MKAVIAQLLARSDELPEGLSKTMDALLHMKGIVGERLAGIKKELVAIAGVIKEHDEEQRKRNGLPLQKGAAFFEALLKFDAETVLAAIAEEIEAARVTLDAARAKRAEEVQLSCIPIVDELLKLPIIN